MCWLRLRKRNWGKRAAGEPSKAAMLNTVVAQARTVAIEKHTVAATAISSHTAKSPVKRRQQQPRPDDVVGDIKPRPPTVRP